MSAAQKLGRDGGDDAGGEREGDKRIERGLIVPGALADGEQHDGGGDGRDGRQDEVAPDALAATTCATPAAGPDPGEGQEKKADRNGDAVIERRADGDLVALHILLR